MSKKTIIKWVLFSLSFFYLSQVYSSHILGADISYLHQSGLKYKVVLKVYRDCNGIPLNAVEIRASCDNGTYAVLLNTARISIKDISEICSKDTLPCNPANTKSNPGIEEHIYEASIDFSQAPYSDIKNACCRVVFSFQQCCRLGSITNISPTNFYLESMLDLCASSNKGNSSPIFKTKPLMNLCCNMPFTYNNGGVELAEGDSLSYELVAPSKALNSPETYTGNFDQNIPMTPYCPPTPGTLNCKALPGAKPPRGFYFDNLTGDIVLTPTDCSEVCAIVFKINEWRKDSVGNWQLIGYSKRESTWFVQTCTDNNPPYFAGNNKYSVCEGNKLCFTIGTKDEPYLPKQTILDTVSLFWDGGIISGSFRIIDSSAREKEAEFCWQTKIGDARASAYSFTATAKDDFCPQPLSASRGYSITVKPKATASRSYLKGFRGTLIFESHPSDTSNYKLINYRYKFTIKDSSKGNILYFNYNRKDSFVFTTSGKYFIEHEINNPPYNCPSIYLDSFIVTPEHLLDLPPLIYSRVDIYPNPGSRIIFIKSENIELSLAHVKVYAMDGKLIIAQKIKEDQLDISSLSTGIYTLQIYSKEGMINLKLMVE